MAKNLKLMKKEKSQPKKWVWRNMIAEGTVNLLWAQPSHGKSMFALQLCKELMKTKNRNGYTMLDRPVIPVKKVLYISTEMDEPTVFKRLAELGADGRMKRFANDFYVSCNPYPTIDWLNDEIKATDADFIIIDVIGGVAASSKIDSNSYDDAYSVINQLRTLGKTALCISHLNKQNKPMGSTGWEGACDTRFILYDNGIEVLEDGTVVLHQDLNVFGKHVARTVIPVDFKYPYFELTKGSDDESDIEDRPLAVLMERIIKSDEPIVGTAEEISADCGLLSKYGFSPRRFATMLKLNKDYLEQNHILYSVERKTKGYVYELKYEPEEKHSNFFDLDDDDDF